MKIISRLIVFALLLAFLSACVPLCAANSAVSLNEQTMTVPNIENVNILRLAAGNCADINEMKSSTEYRALSQRKIGSLSGDYSILLGNKPLYTVCLEYKDGTTVFETLEPHPALPSYSVDGMTLTVSNLSPVSVVRYAPGDYTSSSLKELKNAAGAKGIRTSRLSGDSFSVTFTTEGTYTLYFLLNDGSARSVKLSIQKTNEWEDGFYPGWY